MRLRSYTLYRNDPVSKKIAAHIKFLETLPENSFNDAALEASYDQLMVITERLKQQYAKNKRDSQAIDELTCPRS